MEHLLISCGFRSGAGLLTSIVNSNREVSICTDIVKYWNFCYGRYPRLNSDSLKEMLVQLKARLSVRFSINLDVEELLGNIGTELSHPRIYELLMKQIYRMDSGTKIAGECEGLTWSKMPYFLDNVKNSKGIIIIRDPRDVLVSFKKNTIAPGDAYLVSAFNSLSLMTSALDSAKRYEERFMIVKFEDLKNNQEEVVKQICKFLEITFDLDMLNPQRWMKLGNDAWIPWENQESSSFKEEHSLKMKPVGRWKDLIIREDQFICEWVNGAIMEKFGYIPECSTPSVEIFEAALRKLLSCELLKNCLMDFLLYGKGAEKYPLDPFVPANWDKRYIDNLDELSLLSS